MIYLAFQIHKSAKMKGLVKFFKYLESVHVSLYFDSIIIQSKEGKFSKNDSISEKPRDLANDEGVQPESSGAFGFFV